MRIIHFLFLGLIFSFSYCYRGHAATINTSPAETLAAAMDRAQEGDTILLSEGVYRVNRTSFTKKVLTFEGEAGKQVIFTLAKPAISVFDREILDGTLYQPDDEVNLTFRNIVFLNSELDFPFGTESPENLSINMDNCFLYDSNGPIIFDRNLSISNSILSGSFSASDAKNLTLENNILYESSLFNTRRAENFIFNNNTMFIPSFETLINNNFLNGIFIPTLESSRSLNFNFQNNLINGAGVIEFDAGKSEAANGVDFDLDAFESLEDTFIFSAEGTFLPATFGIINYDQSSFNAFQNFLKTEVAGANRTFNMDNNTVLSEIPSIFEDSESLFSRIVNRFSFIVSNRLDNTVNFTDSQIVNFVANLRETFQNPDGKDANDLLANLNIDFDQLDQLQDIIQDKIRKLRFNKPPRGLNIQPELDPDGNAPVLANFEEITTGGFNITGLVRRSIDQKILRVKVPKKLSFSILNNGSKGFEFILRCNKLGTTTKFIEIGEFGTFEINKKDTCQLDLTRSDDVEDDKIPYDFNIQIQLLQKDVFDLSQLAGLEIPLTGEFKSFNNEETIEIKVKENTRVEITDNKEEPTVELIIVRGSAKSKKEVSSLSENPLVFDLEGSKKFTIKLRSVDEEDGTYDFNIKILE